jgi:hypothetical protein
MAKAIDPMGPVDPTAFNEAMGAWYSDPEVGRDKIVATVIPQVDKAIIQVEDWSNVLNNLVVLIGQVMPIISSMVGAAGAAGATASIGSACTSSAALLNSLQSIRTTLRSAQGTR